MNKLQLLSLAVALGIVGAAQAQTQAPPDTTDAPPVPSTERTEGTAADRTPPGETPTRGSAESTTVERPGPATSQTEGTAADRTPPGERPAAPDVSETGRPADTEMDRRTQTQQSQAMRTAGAGVAGMADKHRVSDILDMDVRTADGDDIGEIEDIILDRDGNVTHVVVEYGGTLGIGDKLAALPWPAVSSLVRGDDIVLERSSLESAPSFKDNEWPDLADTTWSTEVDDYWATEAATRRAAVDETPESRTAPPPTTEPGTTTTEPRTTTPPGTTTPEPGTRTEPMEPDTMEPGMTPETTEEEPPVPERR